MLAGGKRGEIAPAALNDETGPVFYLNDPPSAASNLRLTCLKFSVAGDGNAAEDFSRSTGRRRRPSRHIL
jgi:hypothetical protein